ncbi:MAG: hypothetical protein WHV66_00355 [Anaerolineales bacterium]
MEIDLSRLKDEEKQLIWIGVALLLLVGLILLGRYYTTGERVLTWQEWQVRKAERLHRSEWLTLKEQAENLAMVLAEDEPEPVRAALVARGAIQKAEGIKSATLDDEVAALISAAEAVTDWSIGSLDYNTAVSAVMNALQVIDNGR